MSNDEPRAADVDATATPAEVIPPGLVPPAATLPSLRYPPDHRETFEEEFRCVQQVGAFYALMLLPILVATGWSYHARSNAIEIQLWAEGAMYTVIAVAAVIWRRDWFHLLRLPQGRSSRWLIFVVAVPLGTIGMARLVHFCASRIGLPVQDLAEHFTGNRYPVWAGALSIIVLAPVFEEIAFRGLLLGKLQRVMRPTQAIWVTAALFGVMHLSVVSMALFIVPLAVAAGYVTCRTKSLLPAICMHAAHNAGVVCFSLLER